MSNETARIASITLEPGKLYRARDGHKVRIYAIDGGGSFPVHGAVLGRNGEWRHATFTASGRYSSTTNPNDIIDEWGPKLCIDWHVLPAWATYAAQDENGKWFWYTSQPSSGENSWDAPNSARGWIPDKYSSRWNADAIDWTATLSSRPK
jgi:hypothetical protein